MTKWIVGWPKEPGWYWLYGDPHSKEPKPRHIRLYPVRVCKTSNGFTYLCEGHFIHKSEAWEHCLWTKAILPEVIDED